MNLSTNFRGLPIRLEIALSRLKHVYLHLHGDQCLLLLALGYAVGIRLGQVLLQESLDHLHNLHLL